MEEISPRAPGRVRRGAQTPAMFENPRLRMARNLIDGFDGTLLGGRFLLRGGDRAHDDAFGRMLAWRRERVAPSRLSGDPRRRGNFRRRRATTRSTTQHIAISGFWKPVAHHLPPDDGAIVFRAQEPIRDLCFRPWAFRTFRGHASGSGNRGGAGLFSPLEVSYPGTAMVDGTTKDGPIGRATPERHGGAPGNVDIDDLYRRLRSSVTLACPFWLAGHVEDIAQSAVVRVLEARRRGGETGDVPAINVTRLAYWTAMDEVRRWVRRRREVSTEEAFDVPDESLSANPERSAAAHEVGRALTDCLSRLGHARRVALTLHFQGHSFPDAGRLLGWTAKKVEHLVYRGLEDVRRCLRAKGLAP